MSKANLETYLNDHLAGALAALSMMEHVKKAQAGSELARQIAQIQGDILADRAELVALMGRLSIPESPARKAMAWLGAKSAEIKLSLDDRPGGPLHVLEAVEAIAIG